MGRWRCRPRTQAAGLFTAHTKEDEASCTAERTLRDKVVESFDIWEQPKTKKAVGLIDAMGIEGKVLLLAENHETVAIKSFRNLDGVIASSVGQANTYDVLWADTIVMSQGTLELGQGTPRGTEEHAAQVRDAGAEDTESTSAEDAS